MKPRLLRRLLGATAVLIALYLLLLIPDQAEPVPTTQYAVPFLWNRDEYWAQLEARFRDARSAGCDSLSSAIDQKLSQIDSMTRRLQNGTLGPGMPVYGDIETDIFEAGVLLAACPAKVRDYVSAIGNLRYTLKRQSTGWDMNTCEARDCIYRLLYGGRIAVEEVLLQSTTGLASQVAVEANEPSATPSATILGVEIHSGDILVSRGGAPTSALIARGSDYPGNFSHVALVYVDGTTGIVSIVESHIEKGVAVASAADYLRDTKLRVLILRLRADLPQLQADSMLPHKAAKDMFERAKAEHIPYDFAMDTQGASKMFCSEVASHAYDHVGVKVWIGPSHISGAGARNWLSAFGVRNFTTEEPSDLEYDPQLCVIAEWRDFETLRKDHLDNAVTDVMLESADRGEVLRYDWYMLPVARVLKAYSAIINRFGAVGTVPEGMTATAALKNKWYSRRHQHTVDRLRVLAQQFQERTGYSPPYWELIKLARQAYGAPPAP